MRCDNFFRPREISLLFGNWLCARLPMRWIATWKVVRERGAPTAISV